MEYKGEFIVYKFSEKEPLADQKNAWSETVSKRQEHKSSQQIVFIPPNVLPASGSLWIGYFPMSEVLSSVFSGLEWI